jgi:hypothetical protein
LKNLKILNCIILVLSQVVAFSQSKITLQNSSFEKVDEITKQAKGWFISTNSAYQTANMQPGAFNISKEAAHGNHFLSLKTTHKDAFDYVGQTFDEGVFLKKDSFYSIEIDLAFSKNFHHNDSTLFVKKKGNHPVYFIISGSNTATKSYEILIRTELVENSDWETYSFVLHPSKDNYDQIQLEVYSDEVEKPGSFGHVLVDNCSVIQKIKLENSIKIKNPSFEDPPRCCTEPKGWTNTGPVEETAPDIQPGYFSVSQTAYDGNTFMGMVIRDNNTSEALTQKLSKKMLQNSSYSFTIALSKSEKYLSVSRTTGESVNYATPCILNIWGGNALGEKAELLAYSEKISNKTWKEYTFTLNPQKNSYTFLTLETAHADPNYTRQNGNILLDDCSDLILIEK